ncbi:hypothetical protein A1Q1_07892 [Trichosporon asahii var. asahii CBS 2479]|uniref:CREG-like beta-barrel domain-containing protein n=1 Tax=Trichosporon asahii var. asahii (strain ATCC 90039 / CBS 2479 / JCM 2466 / KCTC 7840 / NBRC 103889/ NCYC 2677 / UAMH 7654) TaxID=1186058 RepID=J6F1S8_TRIAS|nr:hypothetical protein A1Q1_07892 [Trichosporon asahii var. asahii CBS 2479]EJT50919.1 hypothetical protein A1Q1_07892 [Trichosporon asahii var. asahii CBS 2479]
MPTVERIPRGFHHLDKVSHSKFVNSRYAVRMPRPGRKYTAPKDRIRRWNIVPGDKVRLMVGKPEEKYDTTKQGKDGAKGKVWRVYTVSGVNMVHNRVYLDGLTNVRSNRTQPLPSEEKLAKMTEDERHSYLQQRNFISQRRAVHYSSVQLCVRDAGADSVFATRVATTAPFYDRATRSARWARYAAALSGDGSMLPRDPARDQVRIPWPITQPKEKADPMPVDTLERASAASTLNLQDASRIPRPLIPVSLRGPAPGPQDQDWADEYVFAPESRTSPELEAALPLYLQEELSPRYSRAKQIKGWNRSEEHTSELQDVHPPDTAEGAQERVWPAPRGVHRCKHLRVHESEDLAADEMQNLTTVYPDEKERKRLEECFTQYHPDAKWWLPGDPKGAHVARWARLDIQDIYYIGGFGT